MSELQRTAPLVAANERERAVAPRIYVACLAAYNGGRLHGRWIAANRGEAHIWDEVRAMLEVSPEPDAEEWSIHDYENFEGASVSEYASFEKVCALADFVEERGQLGAKLFSHFGDDLGQARDAFDNFAGEYASLADFAEGVTRDTGAGVPDHLEYYIDWLAMGRDMELNGDVFTVTLGFDQVHIFWNM